MALGFVLIEDMAFTAAEDNEVVETVVDGALAGAALTTAGSVFFASTLAGAAVFTGVSGDLLNTEGVAGLLESRDPYNEPEYAEGATFFVSLMTSGWAFTAGVDGAAFTAATVLSEPLSKNEKKLSDLTAAGAFVTATATGAFSTGAGALATTGAGALVTGAGALATTGAGALVTGIRYTDWLPW